MQDGFTVGCWSWDPQVGAALLQDRLLGGHCWSPLDDFRASRVKLALIIMEEVNFTLIITLTLFTQGGACPAIPLLIHL